MCARVCGEVGKRDCPAGNAEGGVVCLFGARWDNKGPFVSLYQLVVWMFTERGYDLGKVILCPVVIPGMCWQQPVFSTVSVQWPRKAFQYPLRQLYFSLPPERCPLAFCVQLLVSFSPMFLVFNNSVGSVGRRVPWICSQFCTFGFLSKEHGPLVQRMIE